jgi:hypothetical protein
MNKKLTRLIESELDKINRESEDEFSFDDSQDLGKGRHRQTIIYRGKEIGYLLYIDKNWLAPVEEIYLLPDVEYGMEPSEGGGLLDGKKGWIDFKRFKNYDEAFRYASQNFEELVYLFEYGDYD